MYETKDLVPVSCDWEFGPVAKLTLESRPTTSMDPIETFTVYVPDSWEIRATDRYTVTIAKQVAS